VHDQDDGTQGASRETISVVIPTYNYARFLPAALESVLGQTLPPDEIIVVDDGSTDETRDVVERYAARGVRYIRQESEGVSVARNRGIRESRGEFVAFLDADDEWLPEKLELQMSHFQQHPQAALVTGSEWEVDEEEGREPWLNRREPKGAEFLYPHILVENLIGSPSLVLVRRRCLETVGVFKEGMRLAQDWDLWIRMAMHCPVGVVDAPLIHYRRHSASVSARSILERYVSNRGMQRRYIKPIRHTSLRVRLLFAAQSMNLFYSAAQIDESGTRKPLAFALALLALLLDPVYRGRLKWGLLVRIAVGAANLSKARSIFGGSRP
jgi:glycosyltransferase involved in cell wall biosynthesis